MISRRGLLGLAAAGLVTAPRIARGQLAGKIYRVGYIGLRSGTGAPDGALREGLRDLGCAPTR